MAKKNNPHNYPPELLEPIIIPSDLPASLTAKGTDLEGKSLTDIKKHLISEEIDKKLNLLYKHYGANPNKMTLGSLLDVVFNMSNDLIPGFQVLNETPQKPGKPNKWKKWEGIELYLQVQKDFVEYSHSSVEQACKRLIENNGSTTTLNALKRRYYEVLKSNPFVSTLEAAPNRDDKIKLLITGL